MSLEARRGARPRHGQLAARRVQRARRSGIVPGTLAFGRASAFLLDEYIGLPPDHPESYRAFIDRHFTGLVDIDPRTSTCPTVQPPTSTPRALTYEAAIRAAGGVDLQLLGIGADGHLGFNEPTSSLASRTRVKTLTEQTRHDNTRFFGDLDDVPRHVRDPGHRHDPRCAAPGADRHRRAGKAEPIARAVEGPLTSMCPASAIQLHPHATVVVDEAAAPRLTLADYYRATFASKPPWQSI